MVFGFKGKFPVIRFGEYKMSPEDFRYFVLYVMGNTSLDVRAGKVDERVELMRGIQSMEVVKYDGKERLDGSRDLIAMINSHLYNLRTLRE